MLHSLRQDILRLVLIVGRHVSFKTETRSETFETETHKNTLGLETTRCRGRQIFGGANNSFRIYSNLPEKFVSPNWWRVFWKSYKKGFHVYYGEEKSQIQMYFDSQSHSSHNGNKGVETSVPKLCGIFSVFSEILPGFLINQNFWGCAWGSRTCRRRDVSALVVADVLYEKSVFLKYFND